MNVILLAGNAEAICFYRAVHILPTADPVIEEGLKMAPENGVFILCQVGERD